MKRTVNTQKTASFNGVNISVSQETLAAIVTKVMRVNAKDADVIVKSMNPILAEPFLREVIGLKNEQVIPNGPVDKVKELFQVDHWLAQRSGNWEVIGFDPFHPQGFCYELQYQNFKTERMYIIKKNGTVIYQSKDEQAYKNKKETIKASISQSEWDDNYYATADNVSTGEFEEAIQTIWAPTLTSLASAH